MGQEPEIPREIVTACVVARVVAVVSAIMQLVGASRIALNNVGAFDLLTLPGTLINTLLGPVAVYLLTLILLLAAFLLMCALVVGVGLFGLSRLGAANDRLDAMYAEDLTPITALGEVDSDLERDRQLLLQLDGMLGNARQLRNQLVHRRIHGLKLRFDLILLFGGIGQLLLDCGTFRFRLIQLLF